MQAMLDEIVDAYLNLPKEKPEEPVAVVAAEAEAVVEEEKVVDNASAASIERIQGLPPSWVKGSTIEKYISFSVFQQLLNEVNDSIKKHFGK